MVANANATKNVLFKSTSKPHGTTCISTLVMGDGGGRGGGGECAWRHRNLEMPSIKNTSPGKIDHTKMYLYSLKFS